MGRDPGPRGRGERSRFPVRGPRGTLRGAVPILALIVELTFAVLGFLFLLVAVWSGWGLVYMLRSGQKNQQYLTAGSDEEPLRLDHLTPALRWFGGETRLLRISLEAPIRQVGELRGGELHQDLESMDNMLMDVSRQVVDWVGLFDGLDDVDRQTMRDLGVSPEPIRAALAVEGLAFERRKFELPHQPPLDERLQSISSELKRIEIALQVVTLKPYR